METQKTDTNAGKIVAPSEVAGLECWYLIPELEPEPTIAFVWQCSPLGMHVSEDNIVAELPLDRLHKNSAVYILCRKPERGKHGGAIRPHMPVVDTVDGGHIHKQVDASELMVDMKAYGPVIVSKYWEQGSNKFNSRLNRAPFLEALGALATPWSLHWKDVSRKDGLPTQLYLR